MKLTPEEDNELRLIEMNPGPMTRKDLCRPGSIRSLENVI